MTRQKKLKPFLPDLRQSYQIDITITRDNKGEKTMSKSFIWITTKRRISSTSLLSTPNTNRTRIYCKDYVAILSKVEVLSLPARKYLQFKTCIFTLKLPRVEMVEIL